MAEFKGNSEIIINCGETIASLCDQYNTTINELFDSLSKINQTAWSGLSANKYVEQLSIDRDTYINFGNDLKCYGLVVKNIGVNVETIVSKWENK